MKKTNVVYSVPATALTPSHHRVEADLAPETLLGRCGDELVGPQLRLRMVGREFAFQSYPSLTSKYLSDREGRNRGDSEGGQDL